MKKPSAFALILSIACMAAVLFADSSGFAQQSEGLHAHGRPAVKAGQTGHSCLMVFSRNDFGKYVASISQSYNVEVWYQLAHDGTTPAQLLDLLKSFDEKLSKLSLSAIHSSIVVHAALVRSR